MTKKCTLPFSVHPKHGECTLHLGFLHTTVKDGVTYAWPYREIPSKVTEK